MHCFVRILSVAAIALFLAAPVAADLIGHGGMVRSVDVSPDGERILTGSFDYSARLWDAGDQSEVKILDLHEGPVTSVGFSPDGVHGLTTSDDFTAIFWNLDTGEMVQRLKGHKHKVMTSAFSRDGRRVVTGSWDNTARVWDVASGETQVVLSTNGPVNAVAFFDDDRFIATGGHHPVIEIWNAETGDIAGKLEGHRAGITALRVSPDGTYALSSSIDKTIMLWDLQSQQMIREIEVRDGQVFDVRFSPDGRRAVTAGRDGYIVEWNLDDGMPLHEIYAHERIVWSVAYTPDGRFAVSASSDEEARVWHLETGDRIGIRTDRVAEAQPWLESDHPGASLYPKCAQCHALEADGPARSGPHFEGLYGRPAGAVAGYRYSSALTDVDFVWDSENLFRLFDEGPDKMLPGTKMPIQKVTNPDDLADLVDYLRILTTE